jgi:hypothetical protein
MTQTQADDYIIGYWKKTAQENDQRAKELEELASKVLDAHRRDFMQTEAKFLRDQAARFREMAKTWGDTAA